MINIKNTLSLLGINKNNNGLVYILCYECDSFRISCIPLITSIDVRIERIK